MSTETGIRIKKIREFRNYTQTHMADKLKISQNAYSKIENGITPVTTDRLEQIAKALDVPVESILNGERQVFNLDNNNIDKFYGFIENLQEENREAIQQTISMQTQQIDYLKGQNEQLMKTIAAMTQKLKARQTLWGSGCKPPPAIFGISTKNH